MSSSEKICRTCGATYPATVVFCPTDGAVLEAADGDPLVGKVLADRYRIISRIGEGGMGQVYLAEHVHMRRKCAVKFLTPDLAGNDSAMKRFMREAENASRIDHPNVVTMYDFGRTDDGTVYLAMEYIDGESLRKRVDRDGVMATEVIASVVRQTASALAAAHQLEIVHRDLKPDNIMLVVRGDEVRVKVVDFGIAKARDPKQKVTVTGAIVGTPDYMSPEQVTGDQVDGRSDQYALALVAVKMLTGKLPFANTTGVESLTSRLFSEPMPLRTLKTDVAWPQQLQDVINKALHSSPDQRFASVMEFARAFDRAVSQLQGAVSATVAELSLGDIPRTRQLAPSARVEAPPADAPPAAASRPTRRPPWLMAAAIAVVIVGGSSAYFLTGDSAPPDAAPLNLPIGASTAAPAADSLAIVQSAASSRRADSPAAEPATTSSAPPPPVATASAQRPVSSRRDTLPRPAARDTQPAKPASDAKASAPATAPAPVTKPAAPAAADTAVARPAEPPRPAALTASEVSAEIARLRPLITAESPRADVESAIGALGRMLPRVAARSDSIRVLYTRAQAQAVNEDVAAACRSLGTALPLARGTTVEETITRTSRSLGCQ